MRARYRARALADLEEIYRYLEQRSPSGARNVLRSINAAIDHVLRYPESAERTSDPDVRVKVIGRYRYKIFYSVIDTETIDVLHIRHTSRRPWERT